MKWEEKSKVVIVWTIKNANVGNHARRGLQITDVPVVVVVEDDDDDVSGLTSVWDRAAPVHQDPRSRILSNRADIDTSSA